MSKRHGLHATRQAAIERSGAHRSLAPWVRPQRSRQTEELTRPEDSAARSEPASEDGGIPLRYSPDPPGRDFATALGGPQAHLAVADKSLVNWRQATRPATGAAR